MPPGYLIKRGDSTFDIRFVNEELLTHHPTTKGYTVCDMDMVRKCPPEADYGEEWEKHLQRVQNITLVTPKGADFTFLYKLKVPHATSQ